MAEEETIESQIEVAMASRIPHFRQQAEYVLNFCVYLHFYLSIFLLLLNCLRLYFSLQIVLLYM